MQGSPSRFSRILAVWALASLPGLVPANEPSADLLLTNGKIFTGSDAHPFATALAIRGERIIAVGDAEALKAFVSSSTRTIDLGGRVVIPGINDAHCHLSVEPNHAEAETRAFDPPWPVLKAALIEKIKTTPPGTLVEGSMAFTVFNDLDVNRDSLDDLSRDHALMVGTLTGHAAILNSAALTLLGVSESQRDPEGGRFERDAKGRLTGVVREYALMGLDRALAAATSDADAKEQLQETLTRAAAWGITTLQDMSNAIEPARAVRLLASLPTPLRVRVIRMPLTTPEGRDVKEGRALPPNPAPNVSVSGTKWLADGVPLEFTLDARGSHDARALGFDAGAKVLPATFSADEIKRILRESLRSHDQLLLHVSGYPAALTTLEAMQSLGGAKVWSDKRVRFEHGDGLFPDLIPKVHELGIVVVQNPTHFPAALTGVKHSQPVKSLLDAAIPVALGSDGPMNPYLNMLLAVTHPSRPEEGLTREQAVIAYTRSAAYAEFAEKDKGTLAPGMLADLAVLSQDIFTAPLPDLPKTQALLTLVGGRIVHDAHALN